MSGGDVGVWLDWDRKRREEVSPRSKRSTVRRSHATQDTHKDVDMNIDTIHHFLILSQR